MQKKHVKAFTLVEVLVSSIVMISLSVTFGKAFSTTFKANQLSTDRSQALLLLQKSQEEVLRASHVYFDSLNLCHFPQESTFSKDCGFQDIRNLDEFSDFQRSLNVTLENGSTELRRAYVQVNWTDFNGQNHTVDSVFLITRPPDPLPGNIIGLVNSDLNGNPPLKGVIVNLARLSSNGTPVPIGSTTSGNVSNGINFNFSQSGVFTLPPDSYRLTATATGYKNYTHPDTIFLGSGDEKTVNFTMEAYPSPAKIIVSLKNVKNANSRVNLSNWRSDINLYDNGNLIQRTNNCDRSCTFTVNFTKIETKSFTVNTWDSIAGAWVGNYSCQASPVKYNPNGWSSAQISEEGAIDCTKPMQGNAASDRILVNSGETVHVQADFVLIPTTTVSGTVTDHEGKPIPNATIEYSIPTRVNNQGNTYWWSGKGNATADKNGNFTIRLPAQESYYAQPGAYISLRAKTRITRTTCCSSPENIDKYSAWKQVGPLLEGTPVNSVKLAIYTVPPNVDCGNLRGVIQDAELGLGLNGATVNVSSMNRNSNSLGDYIYQCNTPELGYRIVPNSYGVTVSKGGYYTFQSWGNSQYKNQGNASVQAKKTTVYNVRLLRAGWGKVNVTVIDKDTEVPLNNASVEFRYYGSANNPIKQNTNNSGMTSTWFLETWPPADLPKNDPHFNYNKRSHSIYVKRNGYYDASATINKLDAGDTIEETIRMTKIPETPKPGL